MLRTPWACCGVFLRTLAVALAAVQGAQALAATEVPPIEDFVVQRPGEVLFDRDTRREQLRLASPEARAVLCGVPRKGWPRHGVTRNIHGDKQSGSKLSLTLMEAGAVHLAYGDKSARKAVVDNLYPWASKGALSRFKEGPEPSAYYQLDRTLLPSIVSFWLVRDDPKVPEERRLVIRTWLERLVIRRGPARFVDPERISSRNNHRYLSDSVTMAWGAYSGNDDMFRAGVERYFIALEQMRDDGSFPLETARGESALSYQRHAIGSLVVIAEIAATQGYDLYSMTGPDDRSIHKAIEFLVRGLEDESAVKDYAPTTQDLGFMIHRNHGRHYMAWVEAYRARFPDRALTGRLVTALNRSGDAAPPLLDDYAGGVTSCFFGTPGAS